MAVVSGYPKELIGKRSSSTDSESSRYFRHFIVKVSVVTDTPFIAESAVGIPRVGDAHPDNPVATVREVSVDPYSELSETYEVAVTYSTPIAGAPGDENQNPLLRPSKYSGGSEKVSTPLARAIYAGKRLYKRDGTIVPQLVQNITPATKPIVVVNSAGQPFINVPEYEDSIIAINVTRNESPSLGAIVQKQVLYENKINTDTFSIGTLTVLPGLAKLAQISWTREVDNQIPYFEVTYSLLLREDGWDYEIQDVGVAELKVTTNNFPNLTNNDIQNIKDVNSEDVNQPVLLDGFGKACRATRPTPAPTDTIAAGLLYRKANGSAAFASLGLF